MTTSDFPRGRGPWLTLASSVTSIAVGLWLGSLVHMLLSVASLFRAFPKATSDVAVEAAPVLFYVTERAIPIFALFALAAAFAWHRLIVCRRLLWAIDLLLLASALAIVQAFYVSAKMDALRLAGEAGGDGFGRLHGISSVEYLTQTVLVLAATCLLTHVSRRRAEEAAGTAALH